MVTSIRPFINFLTSEEALRPTVMLVSTVAAISIERLGHDINKKKLVGVGILNSALILAEINSSSMAGKELATLLTVGVSLTSMAHSVEDPVYALEYWFTETAHYVKTELKRLFLHPDPAFGKTSPELESALNDLNFSKAKELIDDGSIVTMNSFRTIIDAYYEKFEANPVQQSALKEEFRKILSFLFKNSTPSLQAEKTEIVEILIDGKKGNKTNFRLINEEDFYTLYDFLTKAKKQNN